MTDAMANFQVSNEVSCDSKNRAVHFNHRIFDAVPSSTFLGDFSMSKKAKTTAPATDLDTFFHMVGVQEAPTAAADDALLAALLDDEIVEDATTTDADALEAAVADAEKTEAVQGLYAEQDSEAAAVSAADTPSTDAEAVADKPAKAKREKKAKEPKAPRVTSITHKPGDRLVALLGGKEALVFLKSEDTVAAEQRAEKFIEDMNDREAIADKVKDKAIMLLTWIVSGKDVSALNEVLRRSFEVLFKDGELTSGKNGNLQSNLLSKPYSPGTAASQANQMFMLFPILGITVREKGRMALNPDSTIVEAMKLKMGVAA
jgi:hypothetical protein